MSTVTDPGPTSLTPSGDSAHEENSFLAHHFESAQQQFDAGKLGMWIFLVTEVLFFGGLFVAYAVYRSNHPEVFAYAHQYLDKTLGALNTVVLIFSSLTMAWAVRCAQLNQQRGLVWCLAITLACAGFFLGIKAVEYSTKWDEGLLWAGSYAPSSHHDVTLWWSKALTTLSLPALIGLPVAAVLGVIGRWLRSRKLLVVSLALVATSSAFLLGAATGKTLTYTKHPATVSQAEPHRLATEDSAQHGDQEAATEEPPQLAGVFFSIYYGMTGVHALHIVLGMGFLVWLLWTAKGGRYGSRYFAPVDFFGLYWHLVDLVWIYLFPLLYLIH